MNFVTTRQVRDLLAGPSPACLLDVRIPEEHAAAHLAGSVNACVFELSFLDQVRRLTPDPARPVVVYGFGLSSLESTEATRQLAAAGYTAVYNFPGGLEEWRGEGLPTHGTGSSESSGPIVEVTRPLDLAETRVEWTGRNLLNRHTGQIPVKSGFLEFRGGWMTGGEVVLDVEGVTCTDLADPAQNAQLVAHLRSSDFLDARRHPEARLVIRQVAPAPQGRPGIPNLQVAAELTLRGLTRPLGFPVIAGRTPDGRVGAQAVFALDRTEWGSAYGSGRFFRSLGRHLVNDLVEIQVRLLA